MKWRPTKGPTISEQSNNYLQLSYSLWESVLNQEKLSCFSPPYGGGDKSGGRMVFGLYARNKASCPGLWVRINPDYQIQNSEEEPRSTSTKFRNQELKCEGEDWRQTPIQHTGKAAHWRQARGMVWKILRKQNQVEVAFFWMREWREESMVSPKLLLAECFSDREKPRRSRSEEQERVMNMGHFKCHPDGDFITLFYTLMHISIRKWELSQKYRYGRHHSNRG